MSAAGFEAIAVVLGTVGLVVTRPRGLNEGMSALIGAAVALALGLVPLSRAASVELGNWNIFLFFLGMMAIATLADQSGALDTVAHVASSWAHGRVLYLYIALFAIGTLLSLFFANDTTALVLTPIVYALVVRLSLDPLPFVFVTTFVADTASIALPVSNPLNVVLVTHFHLGLVDYVEHLWLAALLALLGNLLVFLLLFRHNLTGRFRALSRETSHQQVARSTLVLLAALAAAYLVASAFRFPLGIPAIAGAVSLAINLRLSRRLDLGRLRGEISLGILAFIFGMLIVVQSLHDGGVTARLGEFLASAGSSSPAATIVVTTVGTALGSNLINNLPMALLMVPTLHGVTSAIRPDMIYSTILGCDLGPNLTHLGSLATFIWLFFLRRRGLQVSAWDYFKLGAVVTPVLLASATLGLWVTAG